MGHSWALLRLQYSGGSTHEVELGTLFGKIVARNRDKISWRVPLAINFCSSLFSCLSRPGRR